MNRGAALTGALLTTLATPATWPLALAGFLVRGGLVLVLLPIVVLPSPVGLSNLLGPTLMSVVFQGMSIGLAVIVGLLLSAIAAWIVLGGLVAAALEAEGARIVTRDEDGGPNVADVGEVPDRAGPGAPGAGVSPWTDRVAVGILAARVIAHVPTGIALIWASARVVAVAYRELTSPFDVTSPIALRVLRAAPEVIVVLVIVWMLGEIVGGIAARRIALGGAEVRPALRDAVVVLVRRPLAVLIGFWVPTAGLALVALPSAFAAAFAWTTVRVVLRTPADPFGPTISVVLFVGLWIAGLVLIAVAAAWRAAVWSIADREWSGRRSGTARNEPV